MGVVIKLTTVTNPRFHFVLFSVIYYQCFEAWETLKNFTYNGIKTSKIFRNRFNKKVKYLYTENYKTLMKETEEDTSKW